MNQPVDPPAPEPTGPFYSTWGPLDGPILRRAESPAIGVVGEPGGAWHIGMAFPAGQVEHRRGPAGRSEEHTSELQPHSHLGCRLLLEKKSGGTTATRRRGRGACGRLDRHGGPDE